ncbi:MAG: TonB-dependent receptor [Bacteroidales bacterium]|nr:TonB-dependent receptor [Bacteroidales bacterium]
MNNTFKHYSRLFAIAVIASLFATTSFGRTNSEPKAAADTIRSLKESTITSLRVNKKVIETPASVVIAPVLNFRKHSALTVSNVLATEPGIAFGGDGVWSTNVNVRGFGESRLITLIDGDRVETATDLTASLSMIDVNDVERIEVIKGAQSSLYGTGAMGGIINIITKEGRFADRPYFSGEFNTGYSSVNNYFSNNLALGTGSSKWYLRVNGTYSKAGNIRTPEGQIPNSQFTTGNIAAKFGFKPLANHLFKLNFQNNRSYNVGIPGGSSFPGPADATYKQIGRMLVDASYEIKNLTDKFTSLKISYFYQDNNRDVEVHPNTVTRKVMPNGNIQLTTPTLLSPNSIHKTHSAQLQTVFNLSDNNTFIAGADFFRRNLVTDRKKFVTVNIQKPDGTIIKTNNIERGETPIPTSSSTTGGIYMQDEARFLDNRFIVTLGGRIDGIWMNNEEGHDVDYINMNGTIAEPPASQRITFPAGNTFDISWSANLGLLYKFTKNADVVLNASRSFRAPSLEERFKYIDLGNYVRLGNQNLKPEDGLGVDAGVRVWGNKFTLQTSIFTNKINNMIVEDPGKFIYQLTADSSKETLDALINSNVSEALLYGADIKAEYNIISDLVLSLSGYYTRGRDIVSNTDLPLIPPLTGRFGARYTFDKAGSMELNLIAAAGQDKIAQGETATDGYVRLDFALYTKRFVLSRTCSIQGFAGVENIFDTAYTNHLSTNRGSISIEPGRNFFVKVNLMF